MDGQLELLGVNAHQLDGQNNVYYAWQLTAGGSWSGWAVMPGYLTSVGAAANLDGRIELFGANAHQPNGQNNVYHAWQQSPGGSWSGWAGMPGYLGWLAQHRDVRQAVPTQRQRHRRSSSTLAGSWTADGLRHGDRACDNPAPRPLAATADVNRTLPA